MTKSTRTVHEALESERAREQAAAESEMDWFDEHLPEWEQLSLEPEFRRFVAESDVAR